MFLAPAASRHHGIGSPSGTGRQRLLNFLTSIQGKHTLSGQVLLPNNEPKEGQMWTAINNAGVYPGMFGCNIYGNAAIFSTEWVQTAINYALGGPNNSLQAVIVLDDATPPDAGASSAGSWFTSGTTANNNIKTILSNHASVITTFSKAGVPVVYRPWHEMSGTWSWYGLGGNDGATAQQVQQLWTYTYTYMQNAGLLNWIVWLWSPNHDGVSSTIYPGDAYVDIVGFDTYNDPPLSDGYNNAAAIAPTKLRCFGEYGQNLTGGNSTSYSFTTLINWIKTNAPNIISWMSWDGGASNNGDGWSLIQSTNPYQALYGDSWVLNRGQFSY